MVLYLLYVNANGELNSAANWLRAITEMALMPETTIFAILRLAILLVILYVVFDFIMAAARKAKKRRQRVEEPQVITFKDPTVH
jgi:uncharacterized membrane protein SirB2